MTDTTTTSEQPTAPKKSSRNRNIILAVVVLALGYLGYEQYTNHLIWGEAVTTTADSTSIAPVSVDTVAPVVSPVGVDTTKKDTAKVK